LAAVDVISESGTRVVVAFGDSITDGRCSTTEDGIVQSDRYQRWTDILATRLAARAGGSVKGVVNAGIAGNRMMSVANGPSAESRLDRDVLERVGVSHVILFEGTNDINGGASADEVIQGTKEIIRRVRARGMAIIGVTMIPRGQPESGPWTSRKEAERLAVNAWMRTEADFDGLIDFAELMKGGPLYNGTESIPQEFNCDNVHPNAAGYRMLGESIDLDLFVDRAGQG
jgi:lysophospholipase L1-like esterase